MENGADASEKRWFWAVLDDAVGTSPEARARCLGLSAATLPWQFRITRYGEPFFIGREMDVILARAFASNCAYAFIQRAGHLSTDQLVRHLLRHMTERRPIAVAHVLDKGDGRFALHDQCLVLNLELLRERAGKLTWISEAADAPVFERSLANIHDDYTPTYLRATGRARAEETRLPGSGILRWCDRAGDRIDNFEAPLRAHKLYLYPHTENYAANLGKMAEFRTRYENCIYVANTEKLSEPALPEGPVRNWMGVASGFKPFKIIFDRGFDRKTRMTFIDTNERQLDFMRGLVERWDGRDYFAFVRDYLRARPGLVAIPGPYDELKRSDYDALEERLHADFGGRTEWLRFWKRVRGLTFEFHVGDLVKDSELVGRLLAAGTGPVLFWISGVFWHRSLLDQTFGERLRNYKRFYGVCLRAPRAVWLSGDDLFGRRINGPPAEHEAFDARHFQGVLKSVPVTNAYSAGPRAGTGPRADAPAPWRAVGIDFPADEMLREARALFERGFFVPHRGAFEEHHGWFSTALFGGDWWMTNIPSKYAGHPKSQCLDWTEAARLCPVTTDFFRRWPAVRKFHRLRIMALLPGGYIAPHVDKEERGFRNINFALNNPDECRFHFEDRWEVPFRPGTAFALDLSVPHWLRNDSDEIRFHVIPNVEWDPEFLTELNLPLR